MIMGMNTGKQRRTVHTRFSREELSDLLAADPRSLRFPQDLEDKVTHNEPLEVVTTDEVSLAATANHISDGYNCEWECRFWFPHFHVTIPTDAL